MATYNIVKFGNSALRVKSGEIETVDDDIRQLAEDMLATMRTEDGIGLAAEQIGRSERICIIDVPKDHTCGVEMPLVLINPEIKDGEGELYEQEGCLSFPDIYVKVRRVENITAEYTDTAGKRQTVKAKGLLSRAIQHELDHLNGILLVDHMTSVQKVANAGKLKRLKRAAKKNR
jgi:peptide deformylase